ncbi:hypothetical protein [Streptomyces sp. NPDC057302]|uniref:hypothetical protein n=1 Tax=Streptomyces sp. NPDC057302 TaxID=3346094 RepID=UPI003634E0B8
MAGTAVPGHLPRKHLLPEVGHLIPTSFPRHSEANDHCGSGGFGLTSGSRQFGPVLSN